MSITVHEHGAGRLGQSRPHQMALALTALGYAGKVDSSIDGLTATRLAAAAKALSMRLGAA